jgi:hypothetical protein
MRPQLSTDIKPHCAIRLHTDEQVPPFAPGPVA